MFLTVKKEYEIVYLALRVLVTGCVRTEFTLERSMQFIYGHFEVLNHDF